MNIKILTLSTGVDILGYIESEESNYFLVSNPYVIKASITDTEETFTPYTTFSDNSVKIFKTAVVAEFEPVERLKISYAEKFEIPV